MFHRAPTAPSRYEGPRSRFFTIRCEREGSYVGSEFTAPTEHLEHGCQPRNRSLVVPTVIVETTLQGERFEAPL